jgi:hypothetical protein
MMQFDVYHGVNFFVTDWPRKGNSDESARLQHARQEGESHEFPLQTEYDCIWPPLKRFLCTSKCSNPLPNAINWLLEVLKVNIFRFKMQMDLIWAYNQMAKTSSAPQKKAQSGPLGNYRVCPNSGNWRAWQRNRLWFSRGFNPDSPRQSPLENTRIGSRQKLAIKNIQSI